MDVGGWLRSLGLEEYEAAFRENKVDAAVLPKLTAEDLKDLGIAAVGDRRKLLEAISALRSDANAQGPSGDPVAAPGAPTASRRPGRAPSSNGDVLRLGRLNGTVGTHGP